MPPVSFEDVPAPAAYPCAAGLKAQAQATLERIKPLLIDQIMVQMGWPIIGLRMDLTDLLGMCCALLLARVDRLSPPHASCPSGSFKVRSVRRAQIGCSWSGARG